MQRALTVTRKENFAKWYQAAISAADLAEFAPGLKGCMIIKPWGFGIWELLKAELDQRIRDTGHENCYFPIFIPLSFLAKEAEHADGFAKEMAVVTHHRLTKIDGALVPDPGAVMPEPLIVRPTSETIVGDAFHRWIRSYRDLPVLVNQWANVVRWELRPRLFLRTVEFLWQEGHTAHASKEEAMHETLQMLEVYRDFAERALALPVIAGEKPENERFAGAEATYSIEAMMQDGKALQAGTSHYLGTNFAQAQNIRFQTQAGDMAVCHTTSWGASTRLVGALIMTHGDDDGLRLPPAVAPKQVVIVPVLREKPEDANVLAYCEALSSALSQRAALGKPVRASVDKSGARSVDKRWNWVRRGPPIIVEIGPREIAEQNVVFLRRDILRDGERIQTHMMARDQFVASVGGLLLEVQAKLYAEAKARLEENLVTNVSSYNELREYFGKGEDEDEHQSFKGWVRAGWIRPTGTALDRIVEQLKTLKLSIRNVRALEPGADQPCVFTGERSIEEIIVSRAY